MRWNKKFLLNFQLQKYELMMSDRETYCKIGRSWTVLLWSSITRSTRNLILMSRRRITSRRKGKLCRRVNRKRCTIRPCLEHKSLPLKLKFHLIRRTNHFLVQICERCWKSMSERQCRSKKKELRGNQLQRRDQIETVTNKQSELYSCKGEKLDRHWSTKIQGPLLLWDVKIQFSIASTQGSRLRRRCPSFLWLNDWEMHGSALFCGEVDRRSVKRRWTKEKVSILFETTLSRKNLALSSHSRSFRKSLFWKCSYQSCIATQCTVTEGFYQVCLSRWTRKGIEINGA